MIIIDSLVETELGWCCYGIEADSAYIYNLYVHPNCRGCGESRTLIQMAIDKIRSFGWDEEIGVEAIPREKQIDLKRLVKFYHSMGLSVWRFSCTEKEL